MGLVIGGAVTLSTVYAAQLATTLALDVAAGGGLERVSAYMAIPLVGPWLAIADPLEGQSTSGAVAGIAAGGVLQATGLTMLIVGLAVKRDSELAIVPTVGPGPGLSLVGRF